MDIGTKGAMPIDIVIPSIRHDPKKLLSMLHVDVPPGITLHWYVVSDNPSVSPSEFIHDGFPVSVIVNSENLGAPLSRNVGLEAGSGDYVLFMDDDVVPAPDILSQYAEAIKSHPDAAGYIGPTIFPEPINSFTRGIRASDFLTFFEISATERTWVSWGTTSNILVPRKKIGDVRFSDIFPKHGGGEDIDFCLNIGGGAERFKVVPGASVRHGWWRGGRRSYRRFFRWAFGDYKIPILHPESRFLDFPNTTEMLLLGLCASACMVALGVNPLLPAVWAGAVVASEFAGEQARKRITPRKFSVTDAIESAAIRLSNELGRMAGLVCSRRWPRFFIRFDYFGTGESVGFERRVSGAKFASSLLLVAVWLAASG